MKKITILLSCALLLAACTKTYLDKKPDQTLVVPHTLQDFQALLDNTEAMNIFMPSLQEVSSDDYYVTDAAFQSVVVPLHRNAYLWNKEFYAGFTDVLDWNNRYQQIFYSNVVLEGLEKLDAATKGGVQFREEKGSALFFRAFAQYQVAQLFCKPYNPATSATDAGVPVRIISDINQKSVRAPVARVYTQVVDDLQNSLPLLPASVSYKTRPSVAAANGLLARVYLSMGDYVNAGKYADAALQQYSTLMDYNTISAALSFPFARYNEEVIFHSTMNGTSMSNVSRLTIDTNLYRGYAIGDLRLSLFFKPSAAGQTFRGEYSGSSSFFNGMATDELYLVRSECYARHNEKDKALADLNTLLRARWTVAAFVPVTAGSADEALDIILKERRKELLFRGLRWTDLRRLNMESGRAVTLRRKINGLEYKLPPNDPRYVLPIPDLAIQLSGLQQNPR